MTVKDTYKSIEAPSEGLFKDNGSRFIAKAYPVESEAQIKEIAELKMPDLNAASLEAAMSMIAGTARSMGVVVVD